MKENRKRFKRLTTVILVGVTVIGSSIFPYAVLAEEEDLYTIILKDHCFSPAELTIPASKKVKVLVQNQDSTPEEFESYDLIREKIVTGNGKATLYIGPLKPGRYHYFGEFHRDTARGVIIVAGKKEK